MRILSRLNHHAASREALSGWKEMRFQSTLPGQTRTVLVLSKALDINPKDFRAGERHYYKLALLIEAKTPRTITLGHSPIDLSTHEQEPQSADHGSLFDLQSQPVDLQTLTNSGMSSATAGIADTSQNPATGREGTDNSSTATGQTDTTRQLSGSV